VNRPADAAPGVEEPCPPNRNDPPFLPSNSVPPAPAPATVDAAVVGLVVAVFDRVVEIGTVVAIGSVVVIFGTVVLTGRVVVICGSVVVMVRLGGVDRPATAVLATKPSRRRTVSPAADLTF